MESLNCSLLMVLTLDYFCLLLKMAASEVREHYLFNFFFIFLNSLKAWDLIERKITTKLLLSREGNEQSRMAVDHR